ncbi:MAG: undecaprenyl/decaprenyl-phosphate alpha-N-acetylglucosaminyl 1-phosphate transferase [Bacteroidales bacterium]|jgi:UDP-N-acetylmuramyl pentapeptide phosphotransferase/UDP-N-acetylglucosamine-1-phosphate transferase|nr:undecaprenyl/decaprenyl-phosphate alpha-N-acetylglucosaminyl 1-phosphate transferase [Bacteroidales bacterium]
MYFYYLIIAFFLAFCLELIVIPKILVISYKKNLFDEPGERKQHSGSVSRLGGVTFLPIILFALCMTITISLYIDPSMDTIQIPEIGIKRIFIEFSFLFSGLILLYFIGIMDDLIGVRYTTKFIVQILCGIFMVMSSVWLNDFNGFLGFNAIPKWIGYPLTVFLAIYIINAINLIDGIDGLASGLSIIAFIVIAYAFYLKGYLFFSLISVTALGCLIPFFRYNVYGGGKKRKKKIFMGDTGSLAIGMLLAHLLMRYAMTIPDQIDDIAAVPNPLIIFSVVLIPCFDVVSVIIYRIKTGHNPFKPDKNHLHHKLIRIGLSPSKSLIIILAMSIIFIALNFILIRYIQIKWILLIDIAVYLLIHLWLRYKLNRTQEEI